MNDLDENKKCIADMFDAVINEDAQKASSWILEGETAPPGFRMNDNGLHVIKQSDSGDQEVWICSPFRIEGLSRNIEGAAWGKYISFYNQDGVKTYLHIPAECIEDQQKLRKLLRYWGLEISIADERKKLIEYLNGYKTEKRVRVVEKYGWHNNVYLFPDEVFGRNVHEAFCPVDLLGQHGCLQKGGLDDWKINISRLCVDNSRLAFAVSAAFAAPLLEPLGFEGGGVHLIGPSSIGKSIILAAAASVFGDPAQYVFSWRTTDNALESTAMLRNDSLLILDEIGEMDAKCLGEAAYMITNGKGKSRANRLGDGKGVKRWKTLLLSNGEKSLSEHMAEGGKLAKAGQEIRILSIPAEVGVYGAFEQIYGCENSGRFVDVLEGNTKAFYGVAGRNYLRGLTANLTKCASQARGTVKEVELELEKYMTNSQLSRVIKRFAVIAAGGELATSLGCTGWEPGEAKHAAIICFKAFYQEWGKVTAEEKNLCEQVQKFFQTCAASRFISVDANEGDVRRITNLAGYTVVEGKGENEKKFYFVNKQVFKEELCKGVSVTKARDILGKLDWLQKGKKGWQHQRHIAHTNASSWFYVFGPKVFDDEEINTIVGVVDS